MAQKAYQENQFEIVTGPWEYRNREDQTILKPSILVVGSQNVVTNTAARLQLVKGYTLDGPASTIAAPILGAYDFDMTPGYTRNLRAYLDPATSKGVLQVRNDVSGTITWLDVITTLNSANLNFCDFYDFTTEKLNLCLFVDGSDNIYEWSGAMTTFASATVNTLTKEGITTWAEEGFLLNGTRGGIINGVAFSYTGGESTTTLTGVTVDFTGTVVGTPIIQSVRTTANGALTAFPATFGNALIANIRNQIYVGSLTLRSVYISKVNNYKDYGYATPRVVGEGSLVTLDGNPTALIPQEDAMYMSAGKNQWYKTKWTLSSDLSKESFEIERLKTAQNQGAQSQAMVAKDKNNICFVSYEPILSTLGRVENILQTPQIGDISYAIVNDMNSYDFTDACVKYWKNFILVAIPSKGLIRIYNQTDPNRHYWEAPVTYAISRFYEVNGAIYGHSYNSPESYKLFDGYNFNGQPIPALAVFAYQNYGAREKTKGLNEIYVEGYINQNTVLNLGMKKEMDGCSVDSSFEIGGDDTQIVCVGGSNAPLGKEAIGKNPFGGDLSEATLLPPKFRVIKTMPELPDFYEVQFSLYNVNIDAQWEIIAFGPRLLPISTTNCHIKQ